MAKIFSKEFVIERYFEGIWTKTIWATINCFKSHTSTVYLNNRAKLTREPTLRVYHIHSADNFYFVKNSSKQLLSPCLISNKCYKFCEKISRSKINRYFLESNCDKFKNCSTQDMLSLHGLRLSLKAIRRNSFLYNYILQL